MTDLERLLRAAVQAEAATVAVPEPSTSVDSSIARARAGVYLAPLAAAFCVAVLIVGALALGNATTGQSATQATPTADRVPLPTSGQSVTAFGILAGTLLNHSSGDLVCIALQGGDGLSREMLFPEGYTASRSPVTVYDEEGRSVATEGQPVRVSGGFDRGRLGCTGVGTVVVGAFLP